MKLDYNQDEQRAGQQAFAPKRKVGMLKRLYGLLINPAFKHAHPLLYIIKEWIIAPFTLWPIDFLGFGSFACKRLEAGEPLDREVELLLHFVKDIPDEQAQAVIGEYEHNVAAGYYPLVNDNTKYDTQLQWILNNPDYHADVKRLDEIYDLKTRQDYKGLIIRNLNRERNIRPHDFAFNWDDPDWRFRAVFTTFCRRWDLHGLEYGQPLLLKVTAHPGEFGIVISYPKWMSIDLWRDLAHQEIMRLHRAYGAGRQGPKLSLAQLAKQELAKAVYHADKAAKKENLKGDERFDYIRDECKLSARTEKRRIQELLRLGTELMSPQNVTPTGAADDGKKGKASSVDSQKSDPSQAGPHMSVKLARARAAFLELSPDARQEFQKWVAAIPAA